MSSDSDEKKSPTEEDKRELPASTGTPVEEFKKVEKVIEDLPLPQPKKAEIRHTFQEMFMTFVERSGGPRIDPETAKILAETVDKDNEHKFQFLMQKQKDEAAQTEREHKLEVNRHEDRVKFLWLILIPSLLLIILGLFAGVYLCANNHEVLGASILTAIITGIFAFLAGLGTVNFFKSKS